MSAKDIAAKIFDDIGVKPDMHALQQRIARVRLDISPLDEWRQVPDFVRMLKIRGYAADYGTGDDGRIAFLAIVLAGAKEFMASEGSMRVSSVDGMHMKRHSSGVELLITTKTGDSHYLILGCGWAPSESIEACAKIFRVWFDNGLFGEVVLSDAAAAFAAALARLGVRQVLCFIHQLRLVQPGKAKALMFDAVKAPTKAIYDEKVGELQAKFPAVWAARSATIEQHAENSGKTVYTGGMYSSNASEAENSTFSSELRDSGIVTMNLAVLMQGALQAEKQHKSLEQHHRQFVPGFCRRLEEKIAIVRARCTGSCIGPDPQKAPAYVVKEAIAWRGEQVVRDFTVLWDSVGGPRCPCGQNVRTGEWCQHDLCAAGLRGVTIDTYAPKWVRTEVLRNALALMSGPPKVVGPFRSTAEVVIPLPRPPKAGRPQVRRFPSTGEPRRARRKCALCGRCGHWRHDCTASESEREAYAARRKSADADKHRGQRRARADGDRTAREERTARRDERKEREAVERERRTQRARAEAEEVQRLDRAFVDPQALQTALGLRA